MVNKEILASIGVKVGDLFSAEGNPHDERNSIAFILKEDDSITMCFGVINAPKIMGYQVVGTGTSGLWLMSLESLRAAPGHQKVEN